MCTIRTKIQNSNSLSSEKLFQDLTITFLIQCLQRILWIYRSGSTFRDVLEPIAIYTRFYKVSLSLSRVGATKLVARFRRGGGGGGRGIYAYIPGKLIQDQSRNNHRRRRPTSNFSLSLFLSSTHEGSLERGRKKVTACVTFFAQPLFLSPPLWIAKSTGGSTPLSFSPGN